MAVLYKKSKALFKQYTIACNGCEIVIAKGKYNNDHQPIIVIGLYIPPNITKTRRDAYCEVLHDALSKIKIEEKNPHIFIAGDTNPHNLSDELSDDFIVIMRVDTPPTRNGECLD